jgi:hypothetical protein
MAKRTIRTALAVAASASLAWVMGAVVPSLADASGSSTVCSTAGLPSTTKTVGVTGVGHVTVFTCGDATASGFQQCTSQTIAEPGVAHATVYYCLPPGFSFGGEGLNQSVNVAGVGGVSAQAF